MQLGRSTEGAAIILVIFYFLCRVVGPCMFVIKFKRELILQI